MKHWGFSIFLFLLPLLAFTQEDHYVKVEREGIEAVNNGDYAKGLALGYELYGSYPDNVTSYNIIAFSLINQGKAKEASSYVTTALALDPTNFSTHINTAYYFAAVGNLESARSYFIESIKLYPSQMDLPELIDEIRKVGKNINQSASFNTLADWYNQQYKNTSERHPTLDAAVTAFAKALETNPSQIKTIADEYAMRFDRMARPEMALRIYGYAAIWLRDSGYPGEGLEVAQTGYSFLLKKGYGKNPYQAAFLLYELINCYVALGNDERAVQFLDELLAFSYQLPVHGPDVMALVVTSACYDRLGNNDEARKLATAAYELAEKTVNRSGAVSAANALCAAYNYVRFKTDVNNTIYYGEQGLQLALKYKFENLMGSIISNLALGYFKLGTKEGQSRCIQLYGSLVQIYKDKKQFANAAVAINNVASMFFWAGDYKYAAENFEESIRMAELGKGSMNEKDKLTYYQSQISAYQFLTVCYAHLNQPDKAFASMEGSRSRVLTERLAKGKEVSPATLKDLQQILQPDEAAILYSLFSAHEVTILVVTKKYAQVLFHKDDSFIGNIKDKYLDRMNKEHRERSGQEVAEMVDQSTRVQMSDFQKVTQLTRKFFENPGVGDAYLNEYLQGYYRFLILPVANRLTSIKNLYISPDDVLNYIPFEALRTQDGKYLVEKFGVRYLNSTGALKQIQARKYSEGRKPLLALGGAVYEPMQVSPPPLQTQQDLNALIAEVEENEITGKSQRRAYGALFGTGALNPLPGTLEEVKSISKSLPSAIVYTSRDMTENKLKSMSGSGELSQFKVLHLATHGFVIADIPDLSGVAMSIFPTEQGGEDGFLNVHEIASLKLNTDLTVLSACQTALGKIYSGEGVTGLTQSLLVAGSNAALVSLWPVNDTSTMLFMSGLYKESAKGKSYVQVITDLKRRFIKGEFGEAFKHPNYWAPFIYFGN